MLYPVSDNGKYGYIDSSGKIAVRLLYDYCTPFCMFGAAFRDGAMFVVQQSNKVRMVADGVSPGYLPFSEGILAVSHGDREGLIAADGKWVLPPYFDQVWPMSQGISVVRESETFGGCDASGKIAIPMKFSWIAGFGKGCASSFAVVDGVGILIDRTGARVSRVSFENGYRGRLGLHPVKCNGYFGLVNEKGDSVVPFRFQMIEATSDSAYFAATLDWVSWGILAANGDWLIAPKFSWIGRFGDGLFVAAMEGQWHSDGLEDAKYGYVDTEGKWVISPRFSRASAFVHGMAEIREESSFDGAQDGYIDKTGTIIWLRPSPQFEP